MVTIGTTTTVLYSCPSLLPPGAPQVCRLLRPALPHPSPGHTPSLQTPQRCRVVGDLFLEAAGGAQPGTPEVHQRQHQPGRGEFGASEPPPPGSPEAGELQAGEEVFTVGLLPGSKVRHYSATVPYSNEEAPQDSMHIICMQYTFTRK